MIRASSIVTQERFAPYQELAISIIMQAASDYRKLAKQMTVSGSSIEKQSISNELKDISRFFMSDWYSLLSDSNNGALVLEMLDREVFNDD